MEQRLTNMEEKLSEVENKIDTIDKKLNQVVEALVGNDIASSKGIVGDIQYVEQKVQEHEDIVKRIRYTWFIIAAIGGIVSFIGKEIIEYLINKK